MIEIENRIKDKINEDQRKNLNREIQDMTNMQMKKGKTATVFKLKEKLFGSKIGKQDIVSITNPATNKIETDRNKIKAVTLKYCADLLTNRKPKEDYQAQLEFKNTVHEKRMNKCDDKEHKFTHEMFAKTLNELKKKHSGKYEFIIRSGNSYKNALFKLFKTVWENEILPEGWKSTSIIQIYKGKGEQTNLNNYRNIHLKEMVPKFFGHLVMNEVKTTLMNNMSKFQLGAKAGHRPQEHILVLKSLMALYEM